MGWMLTRPSADAIERFRRANASAAYSYPAPGATRDETPIEGYVVDRYRVKLGVGRSVFGAAIEALRHWEHLRLGWVTASSETAIREGEIAAVLVRSTGLWWLNACRIVYVDCDSPDRFRFAYGTLLDHAESGEERFTVEHDAVDNTVWYDILAYSRPRHPLARLGYPLVRRLQKRFARDSALAMQAAVGGG